MGCKAREYPFLRVLLISVPPLRRVTFSKSRKSNQKGPAPGWFLLRRNTLTPATLRGPAPNGHPCPDGALAASMPLDPLRIACVRPAPKSRSAASEPSCEKDQQQQPERNCAPFAPHTFAGYTRSDVGAAGGTTAAKRCIRHIIYRRPTAFAAVVPPAAPTGIASRVEINVRIRDQQHHQLGLYPSRVRRRLGHRVRKSNSNSRRGSAFVLLRTRLLDTRDQM